MAETVRRWNGVSKRADNMTFTIHYSDGTSTEVKDGVLFTVNDSDTMDVHVGVHEGWQLFGVFISFMTLIQELGLSEEFDEYMGVLAHQVQLEKAGETQEHKHGEHSGEESDGVVIRGIWNE